MAGDLDQTTQATMNMTSRLDPKLVVSLHHGMWPNFTKEMIKLLLVHYTTHREQSTLYTLHLFSFVWFCDCLLRWAP
jgi:hypothetical protein